MAQELQGFPRLAPITGCARHSEVRNIPTQDALLRLRAVRAEVTNHPTVEASVRRRRLLSRHHALLLRTRTGRRRRWKPALVPSHATSQAFLPFLVLLLLGRSCTGRTRMLRAGVPLLRLTQILAMPPGVLHRPRRWALHKLIMEGSLLAASIRGRSTAPRRASPETRRPRPRRPARRRARTATAMGLGMPARDIAGSRSIMASRGGMAVRRPVGGAEVRWAAEGGGTAASRRPVWLGSGRPGGDLAHMPMMLERRRLARGGAPAMLHQDIGEGPAKRRRRRMLVNTAGGRSEALNVGGGCWKPYPEGARSLLELEPSANGPPHRSHGWPSPRPLILAAPGDDGPSHRSRPSQAHEGFQHSNLRRRGGQARCRHRAWLRDGHGRGWRDQPLGAPLRGEVAPQAHPAIASLHGRNPQPGVAPTRRHAPAHWRGR
jgi:hypothetical protein